ncbi:MAG: hypothetical protein ABL940_11000 [Bacteroidia bacterium]
MKTTQQLQKRIKTQIGVFIVLLLLSGVTAFPLETELALLVDATQNAPNALKNWIAIVYEAVHETNSSYPFMAYGTDWLAFAHIVIATVFIGPFNAPVRNVWVIQFGMIACLMVLPLAFICGAIRHIPLYWQLIDCSFGILGLIPLYSCYKNILKLEKLTSN